MLECPYSIQQRKKTAFTTKKSYIKNNNLRNNVRQQKYITPTENQHSASKHWNRSKPNLGKEMLACWEMASYGILLTRHKAERENDDEVSIGINWLS